MTFGERLQKTRTETGYSQEELSFKLQVSRQAVSKWENDQGYPEIDKIIKMADLFDVTMDYFFHGLEEVDKHAKNEKGYYVSQEMASGYLAHQALKYKKIAWASALLIGGISFVFFFGEVVGAALYLLVTVATIALVVSIVFAGNPYVQFKKENLLFDAVFKKELLKTYTDQKKKHQNLIIISVILFCISMFFMPFIAIEIVESEASLLLAISMILSGVSVYLLVNSLGTLQSYRLLAVSKNVK